MNGGVRTILVAGAVIGLLAACAGSRDGNPDGPSASEIAAVRSEQAAPTLSESEVESTLEDHSREYNAYLDTCMGEAGFEFRPVEPVLGFSQQALGVELPEEEFRLQYGFGMSTLLVERILWEQGPVDPNGEVAAELSPEQQEAFWLAYGECQQEAYDEIGYPPGMGVQSEEMGELFDRADEATRTDQRVVDARRSNADCLTRRGYEVESGEALSREVRDRVAPIWAVVEAELVAVQERGGDPTSVRPEDVLDADQRTELDELQQYELSAAAAVVECDDESRLSEVEDEVHDEHLDRILDEQ